MCDSIQLSYWFIRSNETIVLILSDIAIYMFALFIAHFFFI